MPNQKANIKIWIMPNGGHDTVRIMEREIAAFQNAHPNLTVDCSVISWSQSWRRIISAVKLKQTPDVFQIGNTWTGTLATLNALLDVSDMVKKTYDDGKFFSATWSTCKPKALKGIYAIPWFADVRILYYRKDALRQAGLSEGTLNTWDLFEKACEQINGLELDGMRLVALRIIDRKDQELVHNIAPYVWAAGGDFLTADGKRAAFHNREALKGMALYFKSIQKGYAPLPLTPSTSLEVFDDFFLHRRYGFLFGGSWALSVYLPDLFHSSKVREKFGIALVPAGPSGRYTFCGGSNLAISNFSPYPEEAWELIKFLTSNESQVRHCKATGTLPSAAEAFELLFKRGSPQSRVLKDSYEKYGKNYPQIPLWASIEIILTEALYKILELLRIKQYTESHLAEGMNKAAEKADYLLSL